MKNPPDYIYDPEYWECAFPWKERSEAADIYSDNGELWKPKRLTGLIKGPDVWAVEVVLTRDKYGDPDETEVQWFASEAEALEASKA